MQLDEATAHAAARQAADTGRFLPGTPQFNNALNSVIADGDLATGAKFIDNTKFRHIDANYNTIADRDHRAISGLSMGGFMTLPSS